MIKTTVSNETKRNIFAKANAKRIATGKCSSKPVVNGLVLDNYKLLASGKCFDKKIKNEFNNVIVLNNQREVA